LPVTPDPLEFVRKFDPGTTTPVILKIKVENVYDWRKLSSVFPYRVLREINISSELCTGYTNGQQHLEYGKNRYLIVDSFWKLLWVRVTECGEKYRTYGPYLYSGSIAL